MKEDVLRNRKIQNFIRRKFHAYLVHDPSRRVHYTGDVQYYSECVIVEEKSHDEFVKYRKVNKGNSYPGIKCFLMTFRSVESSLKGDCNQ